MKTQLLLLILSLFVSTTQLVAQLCTPDPQYTVSGVYPDSATGLPDAVVNINYDQLITAVVPNDTNVVFQGFSANVKIDSIVVTNSNNPTDLNMPPGIIIASKTTPARFFGNSKDCMKMLGTVTNLSDTGQYFLKVKTTTYVTVQTPTFLAGQKTSQNDSINYYSITVACVKLNKTFTNVTTFGGNNGSASVTVTGAAGASPYSYLWSNGATTASVSGLVAGTYTVTVTSYGTCKEKTQVTITQPSGVDEINNANYFVLHQNIPNPFSGSTAISFTSVSKGSYDLKVYNILGAVVYNKIISAVAGENKVILDAIRLPEGVYSYSLSNGRHSVTKRMIVVTEKDQ